ncbi:MAG: sulfur carrier protein ThiS [Thermodesulfobacteriota bacterium]
MEIRVNGEVMEAGEGATIDSLLTGLGIRRDGMAVELNREIVPRGRYAETALADGDAVEVVRMVGGG